MDGLECSEIWFSNIDLGDRIDSDYYTKNYLHIAEKLSTVSTKKLGRLATLVASAFYPAATQLYSEGDTPFARCVDCVSNPIISCDQDNKFEKIPYSFGKENKGIAFINSNDIIITKVGTPCFSSILTDYEEIALSRTVLGLTMIHDVDPFYLLVFLRCKYGFEQLFRQRELTIQYQLTLPRVRAIDIFDATDTLQKIIRNNCLVAKELKKKANLKYQQAIDTFYSSFDLNKFKLGKAFSIKTYLNSFALTGRLDAEYYQPKYDSLFKTLQAFKCEPLGGENGLCNFKKSIEPGSDAYRDSGIPFVRVSDIDKYGIAQPQIHLSSDIVENVNELFPKEDTILLSKDGSVGVAYKVREDMDFITSGALLHLTVKDKGIILPDYLTLVLNSPIVQLQAERDTNGAIIQHWKPSEIEKVLIPILKMDIQKEIAAKVQESFALRKKSKDLLEYAKQAVEIAIEQSEKKALEWLRSKEI